MSMRSNMTHEEEAYNEGLNPKNIRYRIPDRETIPAHLRQDARYWHNTVDKVTLSKDFMGKNPGRFSNNPLSQMSHENSLMLFDRERQLQENLKLIRPIPSEVARNHGGNVAMSYFRKPHERVAMIEHTRS